MKKEWVSNDGEVIQYWEYHTDKKPTIFMVHGITGSHEGFQYLIPLLQNYRLIIPDLPGFGESTISQKNSSVEGIAKLTNELAVSLKLNRPYLIGHSMGGLVAAVMLEYGKDIYAQKTVLISPVPTPITITDNRKAGALLGSLHYRIGEHVPVFGEKIVKSKFLSRLLTKLMSTTDDAKLNNDMINHHYKNLDYISSITLYRKLNEEISNRGINQFAHKLNNYDILIISGEKDNVSPLKQQRKAAKALNAKLVVLPNVGHLAHYEKPELIAKNLRDFLQ